MSAFIRRLADWWLPVFFLGSIALVLAFTDWHNRSNIVEQLEQRKAATLPPVPRSVSAIYHYPTEFSRFLDDHYGFREAAVDVRGRLWFWLFSDVFSPDVMVGRDHWLFFTGNRELDDTLHSDPLSEKELQEWRKGIAERREWLAARGIKYLFVLAPDKRSIYPEMLPHLRPRPGLTRREQLDAALAGENGYLDLTAALRADKNQGQLYYKWDTHWNNHGAYDAYRAVMERLGLTPETESLGRPYRPEPRRGDLGRLSGLDLIEQDRVAVTPCGHQIAAPDPHLFDNHFREPHEPYEVAPTACATGTGRLLMFHDSFGGKWEPWLSTQFAETVYVWRVPTFAELKRMVELVHPTVVIEQRLERFLIWPLRR